MSIVSYQSKSLLGHAAASPLPDSDGLSGESQRIVRKAQWRLMPFLLLLYFVNYLDRNNIGFAKLQMSSQLAISASAYGFGAGVFFIAYFLLEIPSNAAMHRFGARLWIARILIVWGIVASCMALVKGPVSYAAMRFVLGAAEAGFFPGIILYLTLWFPTRVRVGMMGMFIIAQPLSNGLGAPLSGWLLQMEGWLGLAGWQWMFIFEGVPAVLLGILTLFVLPDGPAQARWLKPNERAWLQSSLEAENKVKAEHGTSFRQGLKHPRVLALAAIYFAISFGVYGLSLWLPTIVQHFGFLSSIQIGLLVLVPYAFAVPAVYFWTRSADRRQERVWHTTLPMLLAGLAMIVSAYTVGSHPALALTALTVAACGLYAGISPFWELPASLLTGAAAAAGIAAINCIGSLAGFAAPYAVGLLRDATGDNRIGLLLLAAVLLIGGAFCAWYGLRHRLGQIVPRLAGEGAAGHTIAAKGSLNK